MYLNPQVINLNVNLALVALPMVFYLQGKSHDNRCFVNGIFYLTLFGTSGRDQSQSEIQLTYLMEVMVEKKHSIEIM